MFGFARRAKEREAKTAEELADVRQAIRRKLNAELREIVAWLIATHGLSQEAANLLLTKAVKLQEGIDAGLIGGTYACGPEFADADPLITAGAMLAQATEGMTLVTGRLDNSNTRGDICYVLGFSRDGSQSRTSLSP